MPIKAVAFDLWETLITDTPEASRGQQQLRLERMESILSARGFAAAAEKIHGAYREMWQRCQELYWSADVDIPCRRQIEHFLEEMGIDASAFGEDALDELEHAYARAALDILPSPVDGAREVLKAIRDRGLSVGLISNTGRTPGYILREVLQQLDLAASIDAMLFSNEHGECKPRRSIFERLRSALGVDFDEMVFVGDNPYVDVYGAQQCGMRAVQFIPSVRGTAVAPAVEHGLVITPHATITSLRDLPAIIDEWESAVSSRQSAES